MKIVIAGVSGFLGSRIKSFFQKNNHKVFDYKKNLPKKIDLLINLAGPDSNYCKKNPKKSILERIKINKKILSIIKKKDVKNFFYISTIHVYKKDKLINENTRLNYKNPYAKSHIVSENFIIKEFQNICNIKIIRLSNCFGYSENLTSKSWDLVINNIIKNIFIKKKIIINSSINFQRDFIPISYFFYVLENLIKDKNKQKIINISSQRSKSIFEITKDIKKIFLKIYKKNLKIEKNFKKKEKKVIIKSKIMSPKNLINLKKYYIHDLKELIIYSKKNFN